MEGNMLADIISYIVDYILNIKLFEIPALLFYILAITTISYCCALILVGFPCTVLKEKLKASINEDVERKITIVVSVCLAIAFVMLIVYREIT